MPIDTIAHFILQDGGTIFSDNTGNIKLHNFKTR